jgi:hypothetical protein
VSGNLKKFPCPYLKGEVDLADAREQHIAERHPELLPAHLVRIEQTLAEPDQIRRSGRFAHARLFSRWFDDLLGGKHVVVVVLCSSTSHGRNWIVTAYIARSLAVGEDEWKRS